MLIEQIISIVTALIIIATAIVAHFKTVGSLRDRIHTIEKEMERMKSRDDLQQQVIDQIGKQIDNIIPQLLEVAKAKAYARK